MTAKVEIRSGSDGDLDALVAAMGQRDHFTDRLARQQDGRGVLLVAWLDGRPVGNGSLSWEPADHPEIRRHLPGVPELDHLEVIGPLWGQGIGTALIRAAEAIARQFGHGGLDRRGGRPPQAWPPVLRPRPRPQSGRCRPRRSRSLLHALSLALTDQLITSSSCA